MVAKFENSTYTDYDKYLVYRKKQKNKWQERLRLYAESLSTECLFCGSLNDLEFHHVNPSEKYKDVRNAGGIKAMNEEAKKCWCLCKECHIKLHQRLCDPLPSTYDIRISV